MVIGISAAALADDFYVSADGNYGIEEGAEANHRFTDLQEAVAAFEAVKVDSTIWVKDGYAYTNRIEYATGFFACVKVSLAKNLLIRGESGDWENGPVICGSHKTGASASDRLNWCGEGACTCIVGAGVAYTTLLGVRLEGGATQAADGQYGGGARTATLRNCLIANCAAYDRGGGTHGCNTYDCTVTNCVCRGASNTYGGGHYSGTHSNDFIFACHCANQGGGSCSPTLCVDCVYTNCSAGTGGGDCKGTVRGCTFYDCKATTGGGINQVTAAYDLTFYRCENGSIHNSSAYGCTVVDGVSYASGSGVCFAGGNIVSNCVFTGCAAPVIAGTKAVGALLVDCVLTNNPGTCVKVSMTNKTGNELTVRRCKIVCDNAKAYALCSEKASAQNTCVQKFVVYDSEISGAISGSGDLYNTLVRGSTVDIQDLATLHCSEGQAMFTGSEVPLNLYNCTVMDNRSLQGPGGASGGFVYAYNTYLRGNQGRRGVTGVLKVAVNCDLDDNTAAETKTACIDAEPSFFYDERNYPHPSEVSPCRSSGSTTAYALTATDLAGNPRMADGKVAIGACEYDPSLRGVLAQAVLVDKYPYVPAAYAFSAVGAGLGTENIRYYWDFDGDGQTDLVTADGAVVHRYVGIGTFSPSVSISNAVDGVTADSFAELVVSVRPKHYVKLNADNPVPPFDTEATATDSIAAAVDISVDGDEVIILPGTYSINTQIVIKADISVHGATGNPEDVIVHETAKDRCFQIYGNTETILHSLVVENGARDDVYDTGGGIYIGTGCTKFGENYTPGNADGIVSNVIVRNCHQYQNDGVTSNGGKYSRGAGIFATGPRALVTHCVITNNRATTSWNGGRFNGVGLHLCNGARAENCLIAGNYTGGSAPLYEKNDLKKTKGTKGHANGAVCIQDGGSLRFCTVVGNKMSYCGGVNVIGDDCRVENCVIAGNEVTYKSVAELTDRYRVCAAFGGTLPGNYNGGVPEPFLSYTGDEATRAAEKTCFALMTGNVVDVADCGLGAGTVETSTAKLVKDLAAGDYRLPKASPAIDLFDPKDVSMPATRDLYGNPRLQGAAYDAGCYETFRPGLMLLVR